MVHKNFTQDHSQTIIKKKKCKKQNGCLKRPYKIAEKKEAEVKGEKER